METLDGVLTAVAGAGFGALAVLAVLRLVAIGRGLRGLGLAIGHRPPSRIAGDASRNASDATQCAFHASLNGGNSGRSGVRDAS